MDRFRQMLGFALTINDTSQGLFEPMRITLGNSLQRALDPLITWCHIQQHGYKQICVLSDLCAEISDNWFGPLDQGQKCCSGILITHGNLNQMREESLVTADMPGKLSG